MAGGKPPGTFRARDPRERLAESTAIPLQKDLGEPAGIVLRAWKRGVIEIRETRPGLPASRNERLLSHMHWLIVGVDNHPVYSVAEIGDRLKDVTFANLNVVMPMPGDIPKHKKKSGKTTNEATPMYSEGRSRSGSPAPSARHVSKFRPGDRVEIYYGAEDGVSGGMWYPAEINDVRFDGYTVTFDTGEAAVGVAEHSIRLAGMGSPTSSMLTPRMDLRVGSRVEVFYGPDEDGWFPAVISAVTRNGSFTVRFDTGEISEGVTRDYLRPLEDDFYPMSSSFPGREPVQPYLGVGSQAEVLWEGTTWERCVIKAYNPATDMYDVDWMDGTETNGVMAVHVRPAASPIRSSVSPSSMYGR